MKADYLSPAAIARDDMRSEGVQMPALPALALRILRLPEGAERERLEGWYWALVAEKFGEHLAEGWRWECEWLRAQR